MIGHPLHQHFDSILDEVVGFINEPKGEPRMAEFHAHFCAGFGILRIEIILVSPSGDVNSKKTFITEHESHVDALRKSLMSYDEMVAAHEKEGYKLQPALPNPLLTGSRGMFG